MHICSIDACAWHESVTVSERPFEAHNAQARSWMLLGSHVTHRVDVIVQVWSGGCASAL